MSGFLSLASLYDSLEKILKELGEVETEKTGSLADVISVGQ